MDPIILPQTNSTPEIRFTSDGNLLIKGRSMPENTVKFYGPLLEWIKECDLDNATLTVCLDYMNSSSSHQISNLLQDLKNNQRIKNCKVKWYYEEGDEDNLDFGREVMGLTELDFQFLETSDLGY